MASSSEDERSNDGEDNQVRTGKYVTDLNDNDVLLGRGTGPNNNEGNTRFRDAIEILKTAYISTASRKKKNQIVKDAVKAVHDKKGRFLTKLTKREIRILGLSQKTVYEIAADSVAVEKTKQALRYVCYKRDSPSRTGKPKPEKPKKHQLEETDRGKVSVAGIDNAKEGTSSNKKQKKEYRVLPDSASNEKVKPAIRFVEYTRTSQGTESRRKNLSLSQEKASTADSDKKPATNQPLMSQSPATTATSPASSGILEAPGEMPSLPLDHRLLGAGSARPLQIPLGTLTAHLQANLLGLSYQPPGSSSLFGGNSALNRLLALENPGLASTAALLDANQASSLASSLSLRSLLSPGLATPTANSAESELQALAAAAANLDPLQTRLSSASTAGLALSGATTGANSATPITDSLRRRALSDIGLLDPEEERQRLLQQMLPHQPLASASTAASGGGGAGSLLQDDRLRSLLLADERYRDLMLSYYVGGGQYSPPAAPPR